MRTPASINSKYTKPPLPPTSPNLYGVEEEDPTKIAELVRFGLTTLQRSLFSPPQCVRRGERQDQVHCICNQAKSYSSSSTFSFFRDGNQGNHLGIFSSNAASLSERTQDPRSRFLPSLVPNVGIMARENI